MADLVGRSIARLYNSSNQYPDISEAYPSLFVEESEEMQQVIQERKNELSALRFKQFAQSFNQKFNKEGDKD